LPHSAAVSRMLPAICLILIHVASPLPSLFAISYVSSPI